MRSIIWHQTHTTHTTHDATQWAGRVGLHSWLAAQVAASVLSTQLDAADTLLAVPYKPAGSPFLKDAVHGYHPLLSRAAGWQRTTPSTQHCCCLACCLPCCLPRCLPFSDACPVTTLRHAQ